MKIVICTTPIRPVPTDFPPLGSLAVIQALRGARYDPVFFDIDGLRPSFAEVIERFRAEAPEVIGISAVVSTAYGYVRKLGPALREALPNARIVLGGNLAASAELLHRFCGIDICVVGEGERIIVNLANYFAQEKGRFDCEQLQKIKGITFLDPEGGLVSTGYEAAIPAAELPEPDFSILEQYSDINLYVTDPFARPDFARDPRSYEPQRAGKKMSLVVSTKGCGARCTFCHRWDRGFRQRPAEKVVARMKYLMDRYNVGFFMFGDENFGSDRKATDELLRLIKPLDILFHVAGVRARTIDFDLLRRMRDAGCVALYYGFETGSPSILEIMEKNLKLEDNFNAARWTHDAGLFTIYQLVLAMPGETHQTISETIEMVKKITEFLPETPDKYLSINYIQALPGTPVYEFARVQGLIGPTLEDEGRYLLTISDVDAADDTKFLNFTGYPYLTVRTWGVWILYEAIVHWWRTGKYRNVSSQSLKSDFKHYRKGGYFNLRQLAHSPRFLSAFYLLRWILIWLKVLDSELRTSPTRVLLRRVWELVVWHFKEDRNFADYRSLRRVMKDLAPKPTTKSEEGMSPLRLGR